MKSNTDLKLVRIPRNAAIALTKHVANHAKKQNDSQGVVQIIACRFIGQAIIEKIQRESA